MAAIDTDLKEQNQLVLVKRSILETCNHQCSNNETVCNIKKDNLQDASPSLNIDPVNKENSSMKTIKTEEKSKDDALHQRNVITDSIIYEEEKLHIQNEKESVKINEEALEQWRQMSEDVRLTQLNHLLEKSSIYANYLLDVIETTKKKEKKRALRKGKKHQNSKDIHKDKSVVSAKKTPIISKKRNIQSNVEVPSKRHKKSNVPSELTNDQSKSSNKQSIAVGDEVEVIKITQNNEEDLLKAKIIDKCFVKNKWKYQVHFLGFRKSCDEWVTQSAIVSDIVDEDNNSDDDDDDGSKTKALTKLQSSIAQIDEKSLLQAKLHVGVADLSVTVCDGFRYFKEQAISDSQPELLTGGILRDYQVTGFEWLKVLFNNAVNGLLADEMGLGKTIQCIAMVCWLIKSGFQGPFLVCAPLSTICNWINEFIKFSPQVPVLLYHGSPAERTVLNKCIERKSGTLGCCPVVVTSYEVLMRDRPQLSKFSWDYLIVDEGHRIKNMNCRLIKELKLFKVTAKVLLTGTPLQNNLAELWSLLNFLLPEVFNDLSTFEAWFDLGKIQKNAKAFSSKKEENIVVMLHKILAPFLLRRTKDDIEIHLPPKRELLVFVPLSPSQEEIYRAIVDRTIRKLLEKQSNSNHEQNEFNLDAFSYDSSQTDTFFERETRSSTLPKRLSKEKHDRYSYEEDSVINISLNNLMVQLRKCCNHPYLIRYPLIPGTDFYRIDKDIVDSCGKLQLLDRMLPSLQKAGHKILLFSQMTKILDILQDYCNFKGYDFFRLDGSTKCEVRQDNINRFNNDSEVFLFLLSTRAGGLGINLTAADTVIIYDSDWNPQNDLQAQDRCHRIGQTRPVVVYRLVSANTVDQFMVEKAEAKRVLERMIINRSKFKGKLAEDLNPKKSDTIVSTSLLSMLQKTSINECGNKPLSDVDLRKIMNRETIMNTKDDDLPPGVLQANIN